MAGQDVWNSPFKTLNRDAGLGSLREGKNYMNCKVIPTFCQPPAPSPGRSESSRAGGLGWRRPQLGAEAQAEFRRQDRLPLRVCAGAASPLGLPLALGLHGPCAGRGWGASRKSGRTQPAGRSRAELETAWSWKTGKVLEDVEVQPARGENTCDTKESPRVGGGVTSRRGRSTPSLSELLNEP